MNSGSGSSDSGSGSSGFGGGGSSSSRFGMLEAVAAAGLVVVKYIRRVKFDTFA
jgi:hypothetical protein